MIQPDDEHQQQNTALNALIALTTPEAWRPIVGAEPAASPQMQALPPGSHGLL